MSIFHEADPSRRRLFRIARGVAAGTLVADSAGVQAKDVMHALAISQEYGPGVAKAALMHPGESLEAFNLWRKPEKSYEDSRLFDESLVYKKGAANNIVGFGDSNLVGPDGTQWRESPIILYKNIAQKIVGDGNWNDFNCAQGGSTTETIIKKQIPSQRAKEGFGMRDESGEIIKCDVWVNAGGNDVASLVHNAGEADELDRIAHDPFADMDLLLKYTSRIEDSIQEFEGKFLGLLEAIHGPYAPNIRQFVIMSIPDFGKVNSIKTQEFNGVPSYVNLRSPVVRRLVENISVRINNKMFKAAERFQTQAGLRLAGINTAVPVISDFSSNQHFSERACFKIAEEAASRVELAA